LKQEVTATTRIELMRIFEMLQSFEHEQMTNNSYGKRGILTSIGGYIGGALGLASQSHVDEIAATMKHIYDITFKSAQTLDTNGKKISKIVETQNARLDILHDLLQDEFNMSHALYADFNQRSINFDVTTQITAEGLKHVAIYMSHLDAINSVRNAMHQLIKGVLTEELVSRELLSSELKALQGQLGTTLTLCHLDPGFYYKINVVRAFRTAETLIISVPIPLSHYNEKFTAVRIIPVPMPSHMRETGYIQMKLDRNILLYSINAGVYSELETLPDIDTGIVALHGKTFHVLHPNEVNSCGEAIIFNKYDHQRELCNFHYWQGSAPDELIIRTDETHALIAGISQVKLTCTGQEEQTVQVNQGSAVIKVDCNCNIRSKNLFLPSVSSHCALNRPRIPRVVYNYNNLLLTSLFEKDKLSQISEIQLHKTPLEIDIPKVQIMRMQCSNCRLRGSIDQSPRLGRGDRIFDRLLLAVRSPKKLPSAVAWFF